MATPDRTLVHLPDAPPRPPRLDTAPTYSAQRFELPGDTGDIADRLPGPARELLITLRDARDDLRASARRSARSR
jgi:hypothetical protein